MSRRFLIITGFLTLIGLLTQWALGGLVSVFSGTFDILLIGLLITLIGRIWKKSLSGFRIQFQKNSLIFGSITGFFSLLLLVFVILSNTFPSPLSQITLSNGKRTIVFIEMSHIATL